MNDERTAATVSLLQIALHEAAWDVLTLAEDGGMPGSFRQTDSRVLAAKETVGLTADDVGPWDRNGETPPYNFDRTPSSGPPVVRETD